MVYNKEGIKEKQTPKHNSAHLYRRKFHSIYYIRRYIIDIQKMSELLNRNERPLIPWKGKTFQQITSSIRKNGNPSKYTNMANDRVFKATPLKHYRREIASVYDISHCNVRTSSRIHEFDMPNGSIVTSVKGGGLANTLDLTITANTSDRPGLCSSSCVLSPADNARRRVRSSGNIKKQYNPANNSANYYTDNRQYLESRVKTFQQNQYNYIRQGDPALTPGDSLSVSNVYAGNGTTNCKKYHVPMDTSFSYIWIDGIGANAGTTVVVDVSSGYYDAGDLNSILHSTLAYKGHYYIQNNSKIKIMLLNIVYNTSKNVVELQTLRTGPSDSTKYTVPTQDGDNNLLTWTIPSTNVVPQFIINNNIFQSAIGFSAGTYPTSNSSTVDVVSTSTSVTGVTSRYQPVYYKPNNPQFAQQGAVSAGALTSRVRYDSITNSSASYRKAYGTSVANALAYGVPENGYTIKDKIGYPNKCYPVFTKEGVVKNNLCPPTNHF